MRMESKLQHAILDLGQNEIEIAAKPPKIIVREKSNKNLSNIMYQVPGTDYINYNEAEHVL